MDYKELKLQERDFKRLLRDMVSKPNRIRRQYLKRKYENVMGVKLDDIPPFEFPENNILKGFGTNRKD